MTVVHEPLMTTDEFEKLAEAADRVGEGVRLEFIDGQLGAKAMPDGDHGCIIEWLIRTFLMLRPELWLFQEQGLKVGNYRNGRARPDGALARSGAFAGQPEWANPDPVLLVIEVTSHDQDTDSRDRQEKPPAYAHAGIPVYLLIDRDSCDVTVYSEPNGSRYQQKLTVEFGVTVTLPEPVNIELNTEPLKSWAK
ncbi:Uma2 family endonuclease [Nocardia sp. XZ_19_385]|uniref:Uma2 family endonuclease n=1 Tax=Nocardia sp. XZ_19_385 TaxID=2769488 RepID=UPI00188E27B8|nr:Uma2 family endonuclease [Nocardia sp. XZ_19_385]